MASNENKGSTIGASVRRLVTTLGLAVLSAAAAGGYVWTNERSRAADLEDVMSADLTDCKTEKREIAAAAKLQAKKANLLRVRVDLARAQTELERGNFGMAKKRVKAASTLLQSSDDEDAAELSEQLDGTVISVSEDLGAMRTAIMQVAESLEEILDAG